MFDVYISTNNIEIEYFNKFYKNALQNKNSW